MDSRGHCETGPAGQAISGVSGSQNENARHTGAPRLRRRLLALAALSLLPILEAPAHEIPTDVVVQAWLKPGPGRVELLLRVPFEAMRDLDIPVRGPGYIDIPAARPLLADGAETWLANFVDIRANGEDLGDWRIDAARLSLPSDRSFSNYESALQHVTQGTLDDATDIYRDQALLDVLLTWPPVGASSDFSIEPRFAQLGLRTTTVLHFLPEPGVERVFEFRGNPGVVPLDPRWHQAFFRFVRLGVDHILIGIDHILFVLCLIVPFRRIRPLVAIITSFTVAHSITLLASAFGLAPRVPWFPPLIETLIALSIVYMAIENVVGTRWDRRWIIAFGFGLVHGFGFSFALGETLQFAGNHLVTSLFAFNIGVELGQLLIILLAVPLLNFLFRRPGVEKVGTIILSVLLAHSGWHWMTERASQLSQFRLQFPALDAAFAAGMMRLAMLLLIVGLALWLLYALVQKLAASGTGATNGGGGRLG